MRSGIPGSATWTAAALPLAAVLLVVLLGLGSSRILAASASANLLVSVNVARSCGIRLDGERAAPPPRCGPATAATQLQARGVPKLQYRGPVDPVSVVRRPGKPGAPVVWVVTF